MVQIIARYQTHISRLVCCLIRGVMRCYQVLISPVLPTSCRFHPTCSEYGLAAMTHYGVIKGLRKSLGRVLRCHPWSIGGYDPVLPNNEEKR